MRPSGPLPPRIYWVRRLFALIVLVVAISVLWWCVQKVTGNAGDADPAARTPVTTSSSTSADDPSTTDLPPIGDSSAGNPGETGDTGDTESTTPGTEGAKAAGTKKGQKKNKKKAPLIAPSGPCDVADVGMRIKVADVAEGKANPITLLLTAPAGTACTQAITPSTLVLRITSGDDVVWSSDDCPDKLLASEVVARAKPAGSYEFAWNGHRSTGSCAGAGALAKPGGYWVEAALIGADAHKGYFDVLDS